MNYYASAVLGSSADSALTVLLLVNAFGMPGRMIMALASDAWFGPFWILVPLTFASGVLYFGLIPGEAC